MRIEFTQLGDGQFVEIKDPLRLKWADQKKITEALKDDSMSSQLDVAERIAVALIKEGRVLDENNAPIMFPVTEETVGNLPSLVVEEVAKAFAEAKAEKTSKN